MAAQDPEAPRPPSFTASLRWQTSKLVAIVVGGILVYLLAGILLTFYPTLRPFLTRFLVVLVVVVAAILAIRVLSRLIRDYFPPRTSSGIGRILSRTFDVVAYALLAFWILEYFGVNVTNALIGAGFLGIVLGLAAQVVIGNVVAGVALAVSRPFRLGDRISVIYGTFGLVWSTYPHENLPVAYTGTVVERGFMYTVLQGEDGVEFAIANGQLIQSLIRNESRSVRRQVRTRLTVKRSTPFEEYRGKVLEALHDLPGAIPGSVEVRLVHLLPDTYDVAVLATFQDANEEEARSRILTRLLPVGIPPG